MFSKIIFATIVLAPFVASASSPISHVGGTNIKKGVASEEYRFGATRDSDKDSSAYRRYRFRQHLDYAFTDSYALRFVVFQDKRKGDNLEHDAVRMEHRFQLVEEREHGWNGGVRVLYNHSDGDKTPHEVELRFLAEVPFSDRVKWRKNIYFEHDVGEDAESGIKAEFRNQVMYNLKQKYPELHVKSLAVGVEMFNNFGNLRKLSGFKAQDHQIGPVVKAKFDNGIFLQTGYRVGVSDEAPNNTAKLAFGRKF